MPTARPDEAADVVDPVCAELQSRRAFGALTMVSVSLAATMVFVPCLGQAPNECLGGHELRRRTMLKCAVQLSYGVKQPSVRKLLEHPLVLRM